MDQAGFIIGFDSDTADIYMRQEEFIDRSAIPWAMLGFLQAPPTTPLYARLRRDRASPLGHVTDIVDRQ